MADVAVLAGLLAAVSLLRNRISAWPITTPMLYVAAGMLLGADGLGVLSLEVDDESVVLVAELTLAMLLFSDASRIDTTCLRQEFSLPARLLGIGLPLTIALGTLLTAVALTDLAWSEAALVAAILAPTDAALGQAVVSDRRVPVRIRQALNVESGLNDGLVVPVVAVFLTVVEGREVESAGELLTEAASEIGLGLLVGIGVGIAMGRLVPWAMAREWSDEEGLRLVVLGGSLGAYAGSVWVGGNGFIAAFVCGLVFRAVFGDGIGMTADLTEDSGQVGASVTFVLFGALMVIPALAELSLTVVVCAVATLTVGRMVPVAISMVGAGLRAPTIGFLGWFGPRGLASMLFGLLVVGERGEQADQLFSIISFVVFASVVLHGLSAAPGARRYSEWFARTQTTAMSEAEATMEHRVRWRR